MESLETRRLLNAATAGLAPLDIAPTATTDPSTNVMIVDWTEASPLGAWNGSDYTGILGQVKSGRNGGSWDGNGIVTLMAEALDPVLLGTLGVAEASQAIQFGDLPTAVWNDQTVDASTVLVKYTYAGDANLDGRVDADDFFCIDRGFAVQDNGYSNGDFDYSGRVDADDFFIIDQNFNRARFMPLETSLTAGVLTCTWNDAAAALSWTAPLGARRGATSQLLRTVFGQNDWSVIVNDSPAAGGTALDTTGTPGVRYQYKVEYTDSTATVSSTPVAVASKVWNIQALTPALQQIASGRMDWVLAGDSNIFHSGGAANLGSGLSRGYRVAWQQRTPFYASPLFAVTHAGYGSQNDAIITGPPIAGSEKEPSNAPLVNGLPTGPLKYAMPFADSGGSIAGGSFGPAWELTPGQTIANTSNVGGMLVPSNGVLDISHALRYRLTMGVSAPGGKMTLAARTQAPHAGFAVYGTPVTYNFTEAFDKRDYNLTIPAGPRDSSGLYFRPWHTTGTGVTNSAFDAVGPQTWLYQRVVDTQQPTGIALSVLHAYGGHDTSDLRQHILAMSQDCMTEYFRQMTMDQGPSKRLVFQILHGGNDSAHRLTPGQVSQNVSLIIQHLRDGWIKAGYDPYKLHFVFGPYHPQKQNPLATLELYEDAVIALGDPMLTVVRGSRIITHDEITAVNGWYGPELPNGDAHMSDAGYLLMGERAISALYEAAAALP